MASAASSSAQLPLFFILIFSTCFLLSVALDTAHPPFSFNFDLTNASSYRPSDLLFQGSASPPGPEKNISDLTCNRRDRSINGCVGRISYSKPVRLYDGTTLASFSTSFTFEIRADRDTTMGDGIAFFLSFFPSTIPPYSVGGSFGLLGPNGYPAYGAGQFVAVEFDTYHNNWDPVGDHVGIDLNSVMNSWNTTSLPQGRNLSGTWTATIKFDNITTMLSASLRSDDDNYSSMEPLVVTQVLPDPRTFLPPEVAVGFSGSTAASTELNQILTWSFNSTIPAPRIPNNKGAYWLRFWAQLQHEEQAKAALSLMSRNMEIIALEFIKGDWNSFYRKKAAIIAGGVLALFLLVVMAWFIISYWKWRNRQPPEFEKQEPIQFQYCDLADATDHFSDEIGKGHFGVVYRGSLKKLGREVAVKKILDSSPVVLGQKNRDFYCELNTITSVNHKNLVKLVGWCMGNSFDFVEFMCWRGKSENNKLLPVYELVPKGSLHDHLHKKEETLTWEIRYKIVKDITCALIYLHHECNPLILHRDIKPSNILLDNNFNAKLADFGLSRILDPDSSRILTIPVGTEGYLDPECKKPEGKVEFSRSTDIYSYGIVLLEITCRQSMTRKKSHMQAADDKLKGEFRRSEMENVIILGLWCSFPDSKKRPSMLQAMAVLEHGKPRPDLDLLDRTSVPTQVETDIDPLAPSSAGSSSYEQQA
ncbi:hypothetical protein U9M48_001642 [Paspalum notatum var. saurae]|uniref:non-specific serine/threonine protein kinase n=1 Tax=Paspalum notatum var. saurae TaxID=547442 RepID=A0AAQ3SIG7_PASNO